MKRLLISLTLIAGLAWTSSASAQFSLMPKKPRANPSQRVPELILILKTDADERKRTAAAEELREFDSMTFSEIVPVLVDVLKHDKKPGVRLEALNSLVKIRPVTQLAGHAIEKAANDDDNWRVRWQAKTSLTRYHLAGYVSKKGTEGVKGKVTEEPPLFQIEPLPTPRFEPLPRLEQPAPPRPLPIEEKKKTPPPASGNGPQLFP